MRRRIVPVAAAAALVVAGLTGCTAASTSAESCVAPLSPGALSESVQVTGLGSGVPQVSIDDAAEILNSQRSFVERAEDRSTVAGEGSIIAANIAYYDSISGELIEASETFGTGVAGELFLATEQGSPVLQGVMCAAAGDVVAVALPADVSEGTVATVGASLVVIAEIVDVFPSIATGATRALPSGFPAVVTDESGRVGVVLPPQEPASETRAAARIEGTGATVEADSMVIGNVLTVGWDGSTIKNTWDSGPENFGTVEQVAQSGATFREALTGFPVGSQVVVIEPGDGTPRVSVVDILAIA